MGQSDMNVKIKILSIALVIAVLGIVTGIASAQNQSNVTNLTPILVQNQQEIMNALNRIQNQSNVTNLSNMLVQNQQATTDVLNKIFILLIVISVLLALSLLLSHLSFLKERLPKKKMEGAPQPKGFEMPDAFKNEIVSTIREDIKGDIDNIVERLNKLEGQGKQGLEEYKVEGERETGKEFKEAPPRPKPGDIRRGKKGDIL